MYKALKFQTSFTLENVLNSESANSTEDEIKADLVAFSELSPTASISDLFLAIMNDIYNDKLDAIKFNQERNYDYGIVDVSLFMRKFSPKYILTI